MPVEPPKEENPSASLVEAATVFIVDDDTSSRGLLDALVRSAGYRTLVYSSAVDFLENIEHKPDVPRCLVSDVCMPSVDGLALQQQLATRGVRLPIVFVTGLADVPNAVTAIKGGAVDFITKPVDRDRLIACISAALTLEQGAIARHAQRVKIEERLARLTQREREVMNLLVTARSTKEIANLLKINAKTVFVHRARVLDKMGVDSLVELSRLMAQTAP